MDKVIKTAIANPHTKNAIIKTIVAATEGTAYAVTDKTARDMLNSMLRN